MVDSFLHIPYYNIVSEFSKEKNAGFQKKACYDML